MKTNILLYLMFSIVFTYSCFSSANNLVLLKDNNAPVLRFDPSGSNAWYPYYINNGEYPGIVPELLDEILKAANIKGVKRTFPPMRTNYALKKGEIDFDLVNLDWLPESESVDAFVFTDGILRIKEYVVVKKGSELTKQHSPRENMGTVRGYYYHNDTEFNRVDFSSEKELIMALKLGRVEKIICGDMPALYWSQQLNIPISFSELHSDGDLRLRLRKELSYLLPRLNRAIKQLNEQGKLNQIIEHYIDDSFLR